MTTQEKLDKFAYERISRDWEFYLDWMIYKMGYDAKQITERIIEALN